MRISHIAIEEFKGVTTSIRVTSPHVVLGGSMGAGKSAVIDGLRLALGLPTPFGEVGLDRLSPSQGWTVSACFEGSRVRMLERSLRRGKTTWLVNGMKVDKSEYLGAVKDVLDVEPHHVGLDEFLSLSGQKRAAMFAAMLDASDDTTVDMALAAVRQTTLADLATSQFPEVDLSRPIVKMRAITGSSAKLCEGLRAIATAANADLNDAKTRLEGLVRQQSIVQQTLTPVEVKEKLRAIDEEMGELNGRKKAIATQTEQYEATRRLVARAEAAVAAARKRLDAARATAAELEKAGADMAEARSRFSYHENGIKALEGEITKATADLNATQEEGRKLARGQEIVRELFQQAWDVPDDWLVEEIAALGVTLDGTYEEFKPRILALAKEIAAEVMGGDEEKLAEKIRQNAEASRQQATHVDGLIDRQRSERSRVLHVSNQMVGLEKSIKAAEQADASIESLTKEVEEAETERARIEQDSQRTAAGDDLGAIDGRIAALNTERSRLANIERRLDEANAITGQINTSRVAVAAAEQAKVFANMVAEAADKYRNDAVQDRLERVMGPFQETFRLMFGNGVQINHRSGGTGRTTEFDFLVNRNGLEVPFDLLSDGETVLTAAAFLSALQRIKEGPGTFLSLNTEALDRDGFSRLLNGVPKLGLDFCIIANNRAMELQGDAIPETWQRVDVSTRPQEAAA